MSFAVIGAGNTGQTMAGYLNIIGHNVNLYDRNEDKVRVINKKGITLRGALEGVANVKATTDIEEAVKDAEFIMVMTTAIGHKPVFKLMKPFLQNDQTIIIFNGNWGVVECIGVLDQDIENKNITICETGAMIFIANSTEPGEVYVKKIKDEVSLSSVPDYSSKEIVDRLKEIFPQFIASKNVLETSLNNSNTLIHPPITLFNSARIELKDDFLFYGEATSPLSVKYVENMDKERIEIGRAMGIKVISALEIINSFWADKHNNLYDALVLNKFYKVGKAPTTLDHRYITEDIPFGLVPLSKLGKEFDVETPYIDGLINIASLLINRDFINEGPDLTGLEEINGFKSLEMA